MRSRCNPSKAAALIVGLLLAIQATTVSADTLLIDFNDSGTLDLTDGVGVFNFLFLGGAVPADPGPLTEPCGPDPTDDPFDCATYTNC